MLQTIFFASEERSIYIKSAWVILVSASLLFTTTCSGNKSRQQTVTIPKADTVTPVASNSLQPELDAAQSRVDALLTEKMKMDSLVKHQQAVIARLNKEVKAYKKTNKGYAARLEKAQTLINSLKGNAQKYARKLGLLQTDRNGLAKSNDSLLQQYLGLKELGSVLVASDIRLEAVKLKRHGKEKKTSKARKANMLRVSFDIDENRIADAGTKSLYLLIIGPDGKLLAGDNGTAKTIKTHLGNELAYSVEKKIYLKQDEPVKDVEVDWKQADEYQKGNYNIEIYNGGYVIGSGSVALR
jgi:chromosome segregation ATPase